MPSQTSAVGMTALLIFPIIGCTETKKNPTPATDTAKEAKEAEGKPARAGLDPEVEFWNQTSTTSTARFDRTDYLGIPMQRRFSVSMNIAF